MIDAEDAARVRPKEHDIPMTAAEEDRIRRKHAMEEQAKVRAIYEELVLKKPQPAVVTIGSMDQLKAAKPGNGNGSNASSETPEVVQPVASD